MRSTGVAANVMINREKPPFDDPRIRRAMALTVDRQAFMANPAGPVLRNIEGGSLAARLLYPNLRQTGPDALPRSPVIGTDAPVQYEQRDDIGAPRKRLPAGK